MPRVLCNPHYDNGSLLMPSFANAILLKGDRNKIPFANGELTNSYLKMGQTPHYRNGSCRALWAVSFSKIALLVVKNEP